MTDGFPALIDLLPTLVICVDADGEAVLVNAAWRALTGRPVAEELGPGWLDSFLPDARAEVAEWISRGVREESTVARDLPVRTPMGERLLRISGQPHHDDTGALRVYVLSAQDVTEEVTREAKLVRAARHDSLTGLANRAEFLARASTLLVESVRRDRAATLMVVDLDDFKAVNDLSGHAAGDDVLRLVASRLLAAVPQAALVARLGGDEFAVLLTDVATETGAVEVADQVQALISGPMTVRGRRLQVAASIGVVVAGHSDVKDLLEVADTALYSAKLQGKGGVAVAPDPSAARRRSALARDAVMQVEPAPSPSAHFHAVHFYRDDEDLLSPVVGYLSAGLFEETVVVVATPEHRQALRARVDGDLLHTARAEGRYVELDAAETLSRIMRGGQPDPDLFQLVCGTMILREAAMQRRIRVYGEMVALLWADGQAAAALQLEDLCNDLQHEAAFPLLCAYPLEELDQGAGTGYRQVCDRHTQLLGVG